MWTHVKALNETDQVTVFLTTHYMDEADRVAHRIAVIDHGHVVAIGSSRELKERTKTRIARGCLSRAHWHDYS
jgi:ABC-2 type transport system ATP-binding protein